MAEISGDKLVLSFSILIASLIVSGSVFFAVGSLNNSLSGLTVLANNNQGTTAQPSQPQAVPQPTQAVPQPTQAAPEPIPTGNLSMQELSKNASFSEGNPNAPVVVVEYSDIQCPFCRRAYNDAVVQMRKDYIETGKVLFVYKDFPLSFHPMAQPSAEAVRCAAEQGNDKAVKLHDALFEFQNATGESGTVTYSNDDIKAQAKATGLDTAKFNNCFDSGAYRSAVQASFNEGAAAGVNGTPTFYIGKASGNGSEIVGAQPYASFKAAIDAALQ